MFNIILLLPLFIVGCITPAYQYEWWEYESIDSNIQHPIIRPELVYIPRHRPRPLYLYENYWYAEPYTIVIYEDDSGYRSRQKVPNSHLRMRLNKARPYMKREKDVESIMKRVEEERRKMNFNLKKRRKNTKVYPTTVDTNNRDKLNENKKRTRQKTRQRTRGRDVESIMKRVNEEKKKMDFNLKERRKTTKVYSSSVDNRGKTRSRIKGRI